MLTGLFIESRVPKVPLMQETKHTNIYIIL